MVFLWIVIILAVLIIALLSLNFKLYLKFDGTTHIRAGIGPVVFTLLPQKKKKIRLRDYTYERYKKNLEKKRKKHLKKAEKLEKKRKSEELKKKADEAAKDKTETPEEKLFTLSSLLSFAAEQFPKAVSKLKIGVKKLIVKVGGNDAAKIALDYGKLEAAVSLLMELLDNKTRLSKIKEGTVLVYADFLAEKTTVELDISVKISGFSIVGLALSSIVWLIKSKFKADAASLNSSVKVQPKQNSGAKPQKSGAKQS